MLALFNGSWRKRATIVVLVIYAVCVAAPAMAFAFSDAGVHCLPVAETAHASNDQRAHHHEGAEASHPDTPAAKDPGQSGKCCGGAFCLTVLVPAYAPLVEPVAQTSVVERSLAVNLLGHGSGRIDRPPRNLASL